MIKIGNDYRGGDRPCFIVAEAGLAHEGDISLAMRLIDLAAEGGAHAVKFQMYRTKELISMDRDPVRYENFKRKELPYKAFEVLKRYAEDNRLIWFATPHTMSAFEFLKDLGVVLYKIGSGENWISPITRAIIDTGKPVFISTGMRSDTDVMILTMDYGSENVAFLHCVSLYPVGENKVNLAFMDRLGRWCKEVDSTMGYSDHFPGTYAAELAVIMGAKIIEKHIKLPESTGQDTSVALDLKGFKNMVKAIQRVERMLGPKIKQYSDEERSTEKWALKGKDGKRPL